MGRLPFDPAKMAAAKDARAPERPPPTAPLTVTQLSQRLGDALQVGFPAPVRVVGEVSGFKPGQHWYFSLKDAESVVQCVMFAQSVRAAAFTPESGQQVVVTGKPDYWARGGRTSLLVTKIDPVGEGALDAAFRALCSELRGLGWFDESRKRPIPEFPRRIAVVTSRTGAALQDVLDTMRRRCCVAEVVLLDVPVQGQGAADHVARALRWIARAHRREGIDTVLVTRGGGSKEDLWTFNERTVAAAIRECPVPVVAAIGHEVDTTIAELVADLRCATPTQAAVRLTPDTPALLDQLSARSNQLRRALVRSARESRAHLAASTRALATSALALAQRERHRLDLAAARLDRVRPSTVLVRRQGGLDAMHARLEGVMRARLTHPELPVLSARLARAISAVVPRAAQRLASAQRHLASVSPQRVLDRGFSYTVRADGRLVRSAGDVRAGDRIRTRVAEGSFDSTVGAKPPRRPKAPDTPDLFGWAGPDAE